MVDALSKEKLAPWERVITIKPTQRVKRLREAWMQSKFKGDITRERILTRVMKGTEGEPMVTRRAKAFAAIVREVPINIAPDELLVGFIASELNSGFIGVSSGGTLERALDILPYDLSDEDKRELKEEIFPYWGGPQRKYERTAYGQNFQRWPREIRELLFIDPDDCLSSGAGIIDAEWLREGIVNHQRVNYEKVLEKGFLGIKKDAEERLKRIDLSDPRTNPTELKKVPFLEGVIMAMEAVAEMGKRFATKARELAEEEGDAKRKAELLKIAEVCDWVPAKPARTFYEALQSMWFTQILHWWETGQIAAISPGRIDQYLYPYYESDIREGRLTKEEAQELIDCCFLKFGSALLPPIPHLTLIGMILWQSGIIAHHIGVGGLKPDGTDATNELSYMMIEAMMHTRLTNPAIGVRIHSKTPEDFLIKACQLCSLGMGHPAFFNDDCLVPLVLARASLGPWPVTVEQARTCTIVGCVEPQISGMDSGHTAAGWLNLGAALEFVLTNGWSRFHHKKLGIETGDPRQFKSFEEVREAFRKQVRYLARKVYIPMNICELVSAELCPTIYQSALIEDCIEKGIPREAGGARYNYGEGLLIVGPSDVGDSLAAIKKLVFEDKKITMGQLCDALEHNFEGFEDVRKMCLEAPKFGNDDDYADEQTAWVVHDFAKWVRQFRNTRGGHLYTGVISVFFYTGMGKVVGALPSGRLMGKPLSDSIAPTPGSDKKGPTAVLKSVGKINAMEVHDGIVLNMRISPTVFKNEDGVKRLVDLLRVFVDQKVYHVQINVVDSDTLRAAQKEPDEYQDLMVKVAAWNDRFVTLPKEYQDGIIARTEHRM